MSAKLQNYLRTYRKRTGLSQDEVAFLLGSQSGTKVSRYERFARQPNLETVLAYELVFSTSAQKLIAGAFQRVERNTLNRAQLLARKLSRATPDRRATRKLEILRAITSRPVAGPVKKSRTPPAEQKYGS
jgi:transcriptional regulator with XRE-family HTH domain